MQLPQVNNAALSNMTPSQSLNYGIADIKLVMQLLSRLYSNPIQTLTQEYICNARDAHREIKQTRPIEITIPTKLNASLIIRDYGPGLSDSRLKEIFINYGASSKRKDNGQTGGFGIGSKSAWAYTDSFLVTTFYNGKKTIYNANKSNGEPKLELIAELATIEPNGVEITIAVNPVDIHAFKKAVFRCCFLWQEHEKPIIKGLVDEKLPTVNLLQELKGTNFTFNIISNDKDLLDSYYSIMLDGIIYPLNSEHCILLSKFTSASNSYSLMLTIPVGFIFPVPNREEIEYTQETKDFLKACIAELSGLVEKKKQEIEKVDIDCLQATKDFNRYYYSAKFEFNTFTYERSLINFKNIKPTDTINAITISRRSSLKVKSMSAYTNDYGYNSGYSFFYKDDEKESKVKTNARLKSFLDTLQISSWQKGLYLFTKKPADNLIKELSIKPVSSLPLPATLATSARTSVRSYSGDCIHYITNNVTLESQHVTFSSLTTKHVYIDKAATNSDLLSDLCHFSKVYKELKFCAIASTKLKKVEKLRNFTSFEDFTKTLDARAYAYYLLAKCKLRINNEVWKIIKDNKHSAIAFIGKLHALPNNCVAIPEKYLDKNHSLVKEYEKHKDKIAQLNTLFPLVADSLYLSSNNSDQKLKQDLINYVNLKLKGF